jgi:hypothetical protein
MSDKGSGNVRSRDDRGLRGLVFETRQWMKREGMEERPLDWEATAGEERAQWWRERLRDALAELAGRGAELAGYGRRRLAQLAEAPESLASAAFEVALDAAQSSGARSGRAGSGLCGAECRAGVRLRSSRLPVTTRVVRRSEESVGILVSIYAQKTE